jgi:hypothetical protein
VAAEHQGNDPTAHVLVDPGKSLGLNFKPGLLSDFTDQAGLDGLVKLKDSAGGFPMAVVAPTYGQELAALIDDGRRHAH